MHVRACGWTLFWKNWLTTAFAITCYCSTRCNLLIDRKRKMTKAGDYLVLSANLALPALFIAILWELCVMKSCCRSCRASLPEFYTSRPHKLYWIPGVFGSLRIWPRYLNFLPSLIKLKVGKLCLAFEMRGFNCLFKLSRFVKNFTSALLAIETLEASRNFWKEGTQTLWEPFRSPSDVHHTQGNAVPFGRFVFFRAHDTLSTPPVYGVVETRRCQSARFAGVRNRPTDL